MPRRSLGNRSIRPRGEAEAGVVVEPLLAQAYVRDAEAATRALFAGDLEQVVRDHAAGASVPGLYDVAEGSRRLLAGLRPLLRPGALSLWVSHDAFVLPFQCHFGGRRPEPGAWVGFLEGALLYAEGDAITVDGVPVEDPPPPSPAQVSP